MMKQVQGTRRRQRSRLAASRGVTFVELMVIIAILSLLVGLMMPGFQAQTEKTRRAEAAVALMAAVAQMEKHALANGQSYLGAVAGTTFADKSPLEGDAIHYRIRLEGLSRYGYTLRAEPQGGQANDSCGVLSIDQSGRREAGDSIDECWR